MFRCTVCQKLYNMQVQYCDCGNDEFIYTEDYVPSASKADSKPVDVVSPLIFLVCIILSVCVFMFFNPIKPKHRTSAKPVEKTAVATSIPDIDAIWNDTPSYVASAESGSPMEVYKKSLQNMLNSNINPKQYSGNGNCTIEFTVTNHGKLVNRKMFKGSGDSKFNNIVLNMLKNTNDTRIPPSDYLGETIKGEVIVQDGLIKLYIK